MARMMIQQSMVALAPGGGGGGSHNFDQSQVEAYDPYNAAMHSFQPENNSES